MLFSLQPPSNPRKSKSKLSYTRARPLYRLLLDDKAISKARNPRLILHAARHLHDQDRRVSIIIVQPGRALQLTFSAFVQFCAALPDFLDC